MRILLLVLLGACALSVEASSRDLCACDDGTVGCMAGTIAVSVFMADPAGDDPASGPDSIESPWQGTWAGSENSSLGMNTPVKAKIKVTGDTISGTWNVQAGGLNPITGTINGEEASITILQGGGMIKATLVDKKTLKYSGIQGYGTLTKMEETE